MSGAGLWLLAAGALAAAGGSAGRRDGSSTPAPPVVERSEDGSTLVVLRRPNAVSGEFRLVVRTGAAQDPHGKAGLAHLLEHLILQGNCAIPERTLQLAVLRAGGNLNAYTSQDATVFELSAPADQFLPLVERLIRLVSNPMFEQFDLERERGVVRTEDRYFAQKQRWVAALEESLFALAALRTPIIGTDDSRNAITRADLQRFYLDGYVPSRISFVFGGPTAPEDARAAVERSFGIPPSRTADGAAPACSGSPELPVSERVELGPSGLAIGFHLEEATASECSQLAALLDLRLRRTLLVEEPGAEEVAAYCLHLRSNLFVVARVWSHDAARAMLPKAVDKLFRAAGREAGSAEELRLVSERLESERAELLQSVESLVENAAETARGASCPGAEATYALPPLQAARPARLKQIAQESFVSSKRIALVFTE